MNQLHSQRAQVQTEIGGGAPTRRQKIKVLYIAGPSRSGSTILSNILGEIEGFFAAGELIDFWEWALVKDGQCGCGAPLSRCPVWEDVFAAFSAATDSIAIQEIFKLASAELHSWKVPLWRRFPYWRTKMLERLAAYHERLQLLYQTIQTAQGCRVIVDSSKNAAYAFQLARMPQIDLYAVHLIRDPRATAYSWSRAKKGLRQEKPLRSTTVWVSRNLFTSQLQNGAPEKYLRINYEDFVSAPQPVVNEILDFLREPASSLPFVDDHQVELQVNHSIYGNPNRYQSGTIQIRIDDEWKKTKWKGKHLVTALTWPLLLSYGYPLFGDGPNQA